MTAVLGQWLPEEMSVAEQLASLSEADRKQIELAMSDDQKKALEWDWDFWARPDQKVPEHFSIFTMVAGRGSGKTRSLTEWIRKKGPRHAEGLIIGANPRDVRDIVLEGRSGILKITPPWERPTYEPTKLLLRWPNGAVAHIRSAEDPGGIRGLSAEWAACDELVKWRFLQETWDQSRLALREGTNVQTVVATTPMPLPLIKKLVAGKGSGMVVAPRTSTYRNMANLSPDYIQELLETYEGTRLGLQELHAEILDDVKGALWTHELIEAARWTKPDEVVWTPTPSGPVPSLPQIRRKVIGVDPSGSTGGDEWGIVVCGSNGRRPAQGFVIDDCSMRGTPEACARRAVRAYFDHGCESMVGEVNYGGEMVERMIRNVAAEDGYPSGELVRYKAVRAGRGQSKYERAVPIVGLYEQNLRGFQRVYHLGVFKDLENEQTTWVPPEQADGVDVFASKWSPNRVDGCVWSLLELLVIGARRAGRAEGDVLRSASI